MSNPKKQVKLADPVHEALCNIEKARNVKDVTRTITKQEIVADLIMRAVKRECKV